MPTCPACAEIVSGAARRCPACGNELRTRTLATVRRDRDHELDADLLLSAVIADTGTAHPPPPLVPPLAAPLEARVRVDRPAHPNAPAARTGQDGATGGGGQHSWDGPLGDDMRDLLPAGTLVRRRHFLRRR